jgi:hypothetical protein
MQSASQCGSGSRYQWCGSGSTLKPSFRPGSGSESDIPAILFSDGRPVMLERCSPPHGSPAANFLHYCAFLTEDLLVKVYWIKVCLRGCRRRHSNIGINHYFQGPVSQDGENLFEYRNKQCFPFLDKWGGPSRPGPWTIHSKTSKPNMKSPPSRLVQQDRHVCKVWHQRKTDPPEKGLFFPTRSLTVLLTHRKMTTA